MSRKKNFKRWLIEAAQTPEERRQQEEEREERRRRRALAKIGLTLEEFEENVREFKRKFPVR